MTIEKFTGGKDQTPLSDQAVLNFFATVARLLSSTPQRAVRVEPAPRVWTGGLLN